MVKKFEEMKEKTHKQILKIFSEFKDYFIKQIKDFTNKMFDEVKKKYIKLNKTIRDRNKQFVKN